MTEGKRGFWASLGPSPDELSKGPVDGKTWMTIFKDGTFTLRSPFLGESPRDRLIAFEHDIDSMRRKSVTGRGTAAFLTAGLSLAASNNRGVVYVTVTGEQSGVRTFTTRNPTGMTLSSIRNLKTAADSLIARELPAQSVPPTGPPAGWYQDASDAAVMRWWDGTRWTEHVQPSAGS